MGQWATLATHHALLLSHSFNHHSRLTTHHSPLTTHHSPLTTYHSPLAGHHFSAHQTRGEELLTLVESDPCYRVMKVNRSALAQQPHLPNPTDPSAAARFTTLIAPSSPSKAARFTTLTGPHRSHHPYNFESVSPHQRRATVRSLRVQTLTLTLTLMRCLTPPVTCNNLLSPRSNGTRSVASRRPRLPLCRSRRLQQLPR